MNAKKAKALRKAVRSQGVSERDVDYKVVNEKRVNQYAIGSDGQQQVVASVISVQVEMAECGRKIYKDLKQLSK